MYFVVVLEIRFCLFARNQVLEDDLLLENKQVS